jgi:hypothetical protein
MLNAKKVIQAVMIIVSVCLFTAANAADVFDSVPDNAMFALRINHLEGTLGQIDQFLAGMAPMPNPTNMGARMQLANMIGDPNMSNVNMAGQIAVFGTALQKDPNAPPDIFIGILIPVTDYSKFIGSNTTATKPDSNGVSTIGQSKMMVAQAGGYALMSPMNNYKALTTAVKSAKAKNLSLVIGQAKEEAAVPGRIWIYGNVQQAVKLYGPMIFAQLENIKKEINTKSPDMALSPQLMNAYFEVITRMMNESRTIMLAADPKPDVLNFTAKFTAIPGTKMEEIFVAGLSDKGTNSLLGYIPDNTIMTGGARLNKPMLIKFYTELVDIFAPALGPKFTGDEKTKLIGLLKNGINSIGKSYVFSSGNDPNSKSAFDAIYVFEVADNNAFQKNIDSWMEMMKAPYVQDFMGTFGIQMTCDMKRNAEKYKDVSIDTFKVAIKHKDPNSPMGQMFVKMYGEGMESKMAMVKGLGLCAVGATADAGIKALIDKALSGKPQAVNMELKNAMSLIAQSEQAQFVGTINYLRSFQNSFRYMPQQMPLNTQALNKVVSKSNIAFAGNMNGGVATLNIAVPKEHVLEIKSAFETAFANPNQQQQKK